MKSAYIGIQNLSYAYGEKAIFTNLNGSIEIGKRTAVMAPSGCGKTTLLFLIAGLLKVQSGEITCPLDNPKISMVFQENRLLEGESILCNLLLVNPSLSQEYIKENMEKAGLFMPVVKNVAKLSGGEKRRVAILRALLSEYDILLLDEPFTGLDEDNKQLVMEYLKEVTIDKTVILVTHNLSEAEYLNCKISSIFSG